MRVSAASLALWLGSTAAFVPPESRNLLIRCRNQEQLPRRHECSDVRLAVSKPEFPTPKVTSKTPISTDSTKMKNIMEARGLLLDIETAAEKAQAYLEYLEDVKEVVVRFLDDESTPLRANFNPPELQNVKEARVYLVNIEKAMASAQEYLKYLEDMSKGIKAHLSKLEDQYQKAKDVPDKVLQQAEEAKSYMEDLEETADAARDYLKYLRTVAGVVQEYLVDPNLKGVEDFMPSGTLAGLKSIEDFMPKHTASEAAALEVKDKGTRPPIKVVPPPAPPLEVVTSIGPRPVRRIAVPTETISRSMSVASYTVRSETARAAGSYLESLRSTTSTMLHSVSGRNMEYLYSVATKPKTLGVPKGGGTIHCYLNSIEPSLQPNHVRRPPARLLTTVRKPPPQKLESPPPVTKGADSEGRRESSFSGQDNNDLDNNRSSKGPMLTRTSGPISPTDGSSPTLAAGPDQASTEATPSSIPSAAQSRADLSAVPADSFHQGRTTGNIAARPEKPTMYLDQMAHPSDAAKWLYPEPAEPQSPPTAPKPIQRLYKAQSKADSSQTSNLDQVASLTNPTGTGHINTRVGGSYGLFSHPSFLDRLERRAQSPITTVPSQVSSSYPGQAATSKETMDQSPDNGINPPVQKATEPQQNPLTAQNEPPKSYLDQVGASTDQNLGKPIQGSDATRMQTSSFVSQSEQLSTSTRRPVSRQSEVAIDQIPFTKADMPSPPISRSELQSDQIPSATATTRSISHQNDVAPGQNPDRPSATPNIPIIAADRPEQTGRGDVSSAHEQSRKMDEGKKEDATQEPPGTSSMYLDQMSSSLDWLASTVNSSPSSSKTEAAASYLDQMKPPVEPIDWSQAKASEPSAPSTAGQPAIETSTSSFDSYLERTSSSSPDTFQNEPSSTYLDQLTMPTEPIDWSKAKASEPETPPNAGQAAETPAGSFASYLERMSSSTSTKRQFAPENHVAPHQIPFTDATQNPDMSFASSRSPSTERDTVEEGGDPFALPSPAGRMNEMGAPKVDSTIDSRAQVPGVARSYVEKIRSSTQRGKKVDWVHQSADWSDELDTSTLGMGKYLQSRPYATSEDGQLSAQYFFLEEPVENFFFAKLKAPPSSERKEGEPIPAHLPIFGSKYMEQLEQAARKNPLNLKDELEKRRIKDSFDSPAEASNRRITLNGDGQPGFMQIAEILNGRLAMFFLVLGLTIELLTGETFPVQAGSFLASFGISTPEIIRQANQRPAGIIRKPVEEYRDTKVEQKSVQESGSTKVQKSTQEKAKDQQADARVSSPPLTIEPKKPTTSRTEESNSPKGSQDIESAAVHLSPPRIVERMAEPPESIITGTRNVPEIQDTEASKAQQPSKADAVTASPPPSVDEQKEAPSDRSTADVRVDMKEAEATKVQMPPQDAAPTSPPRDAPGDFPDHSKAETQSAQSPSRDSDEVTKAKQSEQDALASPSGEQTLEKAAETHVPDLDEWSF